MAGILFRGLLGNASGGVIGGGSLPVMTDLYRWYKSDIGVTMNGSNQVSLWVDQSGNTGGDAAQPSPGAAPVWTAAVLDGYPGLRFDNSASTLMDCDLSGLVGTSYTIIIVSGRRAATSQSYVMGAEGPGATNQTLHIGWVNGTDWRLGQFGNDLDLTIGSYTTNRFHTMLCMLDMSVGHLIEATDATTSASNANTTALTAWTGSGRIGRAIAGFGFTGDIVEIIAYTRALNPTERGQIRTYCQGKYPSSFAALP